MKKKNIKPTDGKIPKKEIRPTSDGQGSFFYKKPVWKFQYMDQEHDRWRFEFDKDLIERLKSFESMTWGEILAKGSHSIGIESIIKEAQERFHKLFDRMDVDFKQSFNDTIVSLRCDGIKRVFGILFQNGVYFFLWHDKKHEISKSYKKHT